MIHKFLLFLLAVFSFHAQAQDCSINTADKNYLSSECIHIEKDAIFVFLNNQWARVPSLHSDARGVYVEGFKLLPWYCSNCGRWTTGFFCCEHCGAVPSKG